MEVKLHKKRDIKELIIIGVLAVVLAAMDITGFPFTLFLNIEVLDIDPMYWSLMLNFILIGVIAFLVLRFLCPNWKLGLGREGLRAGLIRYGIWGVLVGIISCVAFAVGSPLDGSPTVWRVIIEGIVYYIGVAIVEELYVRGLLLNLIERIFIDKNHATTIAIVASSLVFGLGHIFGALGQPLWVIISKVVWTVAMGLYFGVIYKRSGNLWVPIILHFIIDICALPYCFTTFVGYANLSLYIILPTYILLGTYSVYLILKKPTGTLNTSTPNDISTKEDSGDCNPKT